MTDKPDEIVLGIETRSAASLDDVNISERIITVIAVPFEQATPVPFQRELWNEVFTRTAFNGLDATTRRIPATACLDVPDRGHSNGRVVGRAALFDHSCETGLRTELKISRTDHGDETLELARDGSLDVSVGFSVRNRLDQQLDRATRTRRVNRAYLEHIAFVADRPAYPGAKVLAVRSDGSPDLEISTTPNLDAYLDDPIFLWANQRIR